jgi:endonuclease/exonuclease/phosphatase family metal-dependent hydrolase
MGGRHQAEVIAGELGHYHAYESKYRESRFMRSFPVLCKQGNAFLASDTIHDARFHYFDRGIKRLVIELDLERVTIFLVHLSLGAAARHHQLGDLYEMVKGCQRPKIVAGDFNVPLGHREMKLFLAATGLSSANTECRPTFPSWKPKMELDFVLYSSQIRPRAFAVPDVRLSDHLPLVFDFDVERNDE